MFSVRLYICILDVSGVFLHVARNFKSARTDGTQYFFENLVQPYLGKERSKIEPFRFFRKIL